MKDASLKSRVLIVDDTPHNIHMLMEILKGEYAVSAATSGKKALQIAAAEPKPDLILLDIMMPYMNGYEICAKLKASEQTKNIPVIFITALSAEENEAWGLELGAVDYITKPFSPAIIRARLHNHLQLKKTMEELLQKQQEIIVKEERERMARDLHDNLGQIFAFVNIQTQVIMESLQHNQIASAIELLEPVTAIAQQAHNTIRETILAMRGESTTGNKTFDFISKVEQQINLFTQSYGIAMKVDYTSIDRFELMNARALEHILNIIKESLNNIVKHSQASKVTILFAEDSTVFKLLISDNGCGFDVKSSLLNRKHQYGMLFMKERAREIEGSLHIASVIGQGTTVTLQLPK